MKAMRAFDTTPTEHGLPTRRQALGISKVRASLQLSRRDGWTERMLMSQHQNVTFSSWRLLELIGIGPAGQKGP